MVEFQNGSPVYYCGWLDKEGKNGINWARFIRVSGTSLTSSYSELSQPAWEVNITECPVSIGSRPLEFRIKIRNRSLIFFARSQEEFNEWIAIFQRAVQFKLEKFYQTGQLIGEGAFGKVHLGKDIRTGNSVAIKSIRKGNFDVRETQFISREVKIMSKIVHRNVVKTLDIFESTKNLHIVMENMEGGELYDIIANEGSISEKKASQIFREIVTGVAYLHESGIVHCDIKPENILCTRKVWPLEIKLCDFGLANFYDKFNDAMLTNTEGTPGYMAPEVLRKEPYGPPVDMWSCGVVLYVMLSGTMPFIGRNIFQIQRKTIRGHYSFPQSHWAQVSEDAKSLIRGLLQSSPAKRLTAQAALHHKWLAAPSELSNETLKNDLSAMSSSGNVRSKIKRAVGTIITIHQLRGRVNNRF